MRLRAPKGNDGRKHPACRRRRKDPQDAWPGPARRRARGGDGGERQGGDAPAQRAFVRPADHRLPDARSHRPGRDPRSRRQRPRVRTAGGGDDDRARQHRERRRGDEAWSPRLPAEAVRGRRAAGAGPQGARRSARPHRAALPAQRTRCGVQSLRHHRPQPRDPRRDRQGRTRGRVEEHGAGHRRDRHRQGTRRPRDPRPQRAAQHALDQGELRGDPGNAARIRAVRSRRRCLHGGGEGPCWPLRACPAARRGQHSRTGRQLSGTDRTGGGG